MKNIKTTIQNFVTAADRSDAEALEEYLDPHFRVVMNRLFGATEVKVLTKNHYLEKIRTKEFGGSPRTLKVDEILLNQSVASARVHLTGEKLTFVSLLQLVKDENGQWSIISDMPIIP